MSRPACVVRVDTLPGEKRPRFTHAEGVGAMVRSAGDATGLTRMGVNLRTIAPGDAGTNRHFHTVEEEWCFVLEGHGSVRIGPLTLPVGPGDFTGFPPGPAPHHFLADRGETVVLLEGGERRPAEDSGWYPDIGRRWEADRLIDTDEPPPAETGDERQLVRDGTLEARAFRHDVDTDVEREMWPLSAPTGLVRQVVHRVRIDAGRRSTVLHTHDRTDEWVYILDGHATARVGDERFAIGAGDFIGYPAGGPPHVIESETRLDYLMGGQRDADDVVTYPEAGRIRIAGRLGPLT